MEIEATHTNWFLGFGTNEGVRIAFGEKFSPEDDSFVVGHMAVHMSLQTAVKLHNMLGGIVRALIEAKQNELRENVARVLTAQNPDGVIPENKKN